MLKRRFHGVHLILTALGGAALACLILGLLVGPQALTVLEGLGAVRTAFVGDYDPDAALDTAMEGLVYGLGDRWSYYLTAEGYEAQKQSRSNTYVGIGVVVRYTDERGLLIDTVRAGGPAEEAGLEPGEIITAVDGTSVAGDARYDATGLIQGEKGTDVVLTLLAPDGSEREVTVTRAPIETEPVKSEMLEGKVGYVSLSDFHSRTADQLNAAVDELVEQGAEALVFDMRNNGGGYVDEMTAMLDHLLPEGVIFRSESKAGVEHEVKSDANCVDLPMAVLVNSGSYSAAEFFAAELQEAAGARIVGEPTSGKGYSQQTIPLPNGGALNLSTARYTTGSGVSLIGTGVTLDREVRLTEEENALLAAEVLDKGEDPQLQAALALLAG